jgi:hypothetical protein
MGFAFLRKHDAEKLSSGLRGDMSRTMKHRRVIIGLNSLAMASLTVIAAYQIGIIKLGKVGGAALKMMAEIHGIELADSDITAVIGSMRSLPAHPELSEQLGRLRETGFRTIALTNSPEGVAKEQIGNAELSSMFERLFSVDAVRKYKPCQRCLPACSRRTWSKHVPANHDRVPSLGSDGSKSCRMWHRIHSAARYSMVPSWSTSEHSRNRSSRHRQSVDCEHHRFLTQHSMGKPL